MFMWIKRTFLIQLKKQINFQKKLDQRLIHPKIHQQ